LLAGLQASGVDRLDAEVRKLRERLAELDYLRSRADELRAENHLLLEAKHELEDQLTSRDRDVTSLAQLGAELARYKHLLQQSNEVMTGVFSVHFKPIRVLTDRASPEGKAVDSVR